MRLSHHRINDPETLKRLGHLKHSKRGEHWTALEQQVRARCPYPISYDVINGQGPGFTEYSYTEFLNGIWVTSQSVEVNARCMVLAAEDDSHGSDIGTYVESLMDKYLLNPVPEKWRNVRQIVFLPGHNRMDIASVENITRLLFENDDIMVKPHPLTNEEGLALLGKSLGWNRLIDCNVSGMSLLRQCDVIYTTSASEMVITGTALGKTVVNMSNFFYEGSGAYHPIARLLFKAHRQLGVGEAQRILGNIINSPLSGIVLPGQADTDVRLDRFFQTSLTLREQLKPIAAPMEPNRNRGTHSEKTK